MKAYKVELLITDWNDEVDEEDIKQVLENTRYPNHCISPNVKKIITKDLGDCDDDHPLNLIDKCEEEYKRLFKC